MLDTVNLNPPSVLKDIEEATRAIGFTIGSDLLTGSLLRTLAASKPSGTFLDLGTGTGLSSAWSLDGMDAKSNLITVDINENVTAIASRFFTQHTGETFYRGDVATFISSMQNQRRTCDLID